LLGAALVWTALSIINLFWPPLIALQLAVVWVTYGFLVPSAVAPDKGKPAHPPEPMGSVLSVLDEMNKAVEELHETVSLKHEIQKATIELQLGCDIERDRIRSVLKGSEERLSADRYRMSLSEDRRAMYDAEHAKLRVVIEKTRSELAESMGESPCPPRQISLTDLTAPAPHKNPEVAAAVQRHHASLVSEYSKFLARVVGRLQQETELRSIFETQINALTPALLWRIECFEAGGDWRSVASVERRQIVSTSPQGKKPESKQGSTSPSQSDSKESKPSDSAAKAKRVTIDELAAMIDRGEVKGPLQIQRFGDLPQEKVDELNRSVLEWQKKSPEERERELRKMALL
jgi:hypothetical protein